MAMQCNAFLIAALPPQPHVQSQYKFFCNSDYAIAAAILTSCNHGFVKNSLSGLCFKIFFMFIEKYCT